MDKYQNWKPHEILARLFEEGGELARLVNHIYGPKKKKPEEAEQELSGEIGDILYTLICFDCIRESFDKVMTRDKNRF